MKTRTAILLGATGLTGNQLLRQLLNDETFHKIILFSRHSVNLQHSKLEEYIVDLFQLQNYQEQFKADVVFCCIGSTQKKTPDKEIYKKVDVEIPTNAAKLAKDNNIETFIVISALGADVNSHFFYNKMKGKMEANVLQQNIENTYILRPSLISGKRKEKRPFEFLWKQVMKVANFIMVGPLKKYQSVPADTIASCMRILSKKQYQKSIIDSNEIKLIAKKH